MQTKRRLRSNPMKEKKKLKTKMTIPKSSPAGIRVTRTLVTTKTTEVKTEAKRLQRDALTENLM